MEKEKYIKDSLQHIKERLPDNCEVEYQKVKKNNGVVLDGFIIRETGNSIAPTFYLSSDDIDQMTPDEFAKQIVERFRAEQARGIDFDVSNFSDVNWARSNMMFEIVNRVRNADSNLASIPITPDLMITFKVSVMPNACIRVTNEHLHLWGDITPEELLEDARRNAVVMDKATFRSLGDVIVDIMVEEYKTMHPDDSVEEFRSRAKEEMLGGVDKMLYVLSTQRQSNAAMLYPDMLDSIRRELDDNLVILPSSTHEILIMKEADALELGLDVVKGIVREVNRDVVMQDNASDFLSDEILRYDGELRQIEDLDYCKDGIAV